MLIMRWAGRWKNVELERKRGMIFWAGWLTCYLPQLTRRGLGQVVYNIPSKFNFLGSIGQNLKPEACLEANWTRDWKSGVWTPILDFVYWTPHYPGHPRPTPPSHTGFFPLPLPEHPHLCFLLPLWLWSHLEHFVELMSVCFPVRTHGVYQRHLRRSGGVEKSAWHLRGFWPGEWMAAAW